MPPVAAAIFSQPLPDHRMRHLLSESTLRTTFRGRWLPFVLALLDDASSFLLNIHERLRKATNISKPRPEDASLNNCSETWPNANPTETMPQAHRPAATKLSDKKVNQGSCDTP